MGREIERKFLVRGEGWRDAVTRSRRIRQAYLGLSGKANVRVRIIDDAKARLTIKSAEAGMSRAEFEYEIPLADAEAMMELCTGTTIEKRRYSVPADNGLHWDIDVFEGRHRGLVLAEIELPEEGEIGALPEWLGEEVTDDERFYNAALARETT